MKRHAGFTVLELLIVLSFLLVGGWLFFTEKARIDSVTRDSQRKIAINAMYYNLEEVFYEKNHYYPASIDSKALRAMDPGLFTDPNQTKLGEAGADYRYTAEDCTTDGHCKAYELRSSMEREADYVKNNRNS